MNKIKLILFLAVVLNLSIFAQEKVKSATDFSGTWILDEKNSFPTAERELFEDFTLVISQNETEITISQAFSFRRNPFKFTINLFTDKRGERNVYPVRKFYLTGDINNYQLEDL